MQKNKIFSTLCLIGGLFFLASCTEERTPYNAITNPDTLREITDNYSSAPSRPNDFIPQGNGTVIDKRTGLQWMRCSLGQKWTGKTCSGEPSEYKWRDAHKQSPEFAGYGDWRLPNLAELATLIYCRTGIYEERGGNGVGLLDFCKGENHSPTIARQAFPRTGGEYKTYWSSSTDAYGNDGACGVSNSTMALTSSAIRSVAFM